MKRISKERLALGLVALLAAAIAPNLFPAAQAGIAKMSDLALRVLIPSMALLAIAVVLTIVRKHRVLGGRMIVGIAAGSIATLGLELVRLTSFHFGGMPGNLPRLLGVLITDRFMLGPSTLSDIVGYGYHVWNGACFGLIFALALGRRTLRWTLMYSIAIAVGFLASPAVQAMGVSFMATRMPSMIVTVLVAHLAYGAVLGVLLWRWLPEGRWMSTAESGEVK
jgi:hypothetical protein